MCSIHKSAAGSRQAYSNMLHCTQNREADQDWLKGRFDMLDEVLRNTPAYQRILKEGRDKGLEEAQQLILDVSDDEEQD
jgi:hypothetical protein